jgi:hypothetical protein
MSANREPVPINASTADRLLEGETVDGCERLAHLLAAASAPGLPEELAGQDAALEAFRTARRAPFPRTRKLSMFARSRAARFLTIKAAAVVVVVGGIGGVALAAGTGNLPEQVQRHLPGTETTSGHPNAPATATWSAKSSASVSLRELCREYASRDSDRRRKALKNSTEFQALVDQVGSRDRERVDQFCSQLPQRDGGEQQNVPGGSWPPGRQSNLPDDRDGYQRSPGQPGAGAQLPSNQPNWQPTSQRPGNPNGSYR